MNTIIIAVVSVTAIGIICAALLSIASKMMALKVDERIALLEEFMPGINCGACGYPGCNGYAVALIENKNIESNLCTPGGFEVVKKISAFLGVEADDVAKKTAVIHCRGDCNLQQKKMDYKGIKTCAGAKQLFGGDGACAFGCLGYGDCKIVCPSNAICMYNSLAVIKTDLCTCCSLCIKTCPNNLISIVDGDITVAVFCKSTDKGAVTRKKCSSGCIGCGKCVRECPESAIIVKDNLAVIDYEKCTFCGICADVCITGCIQKKAIENIKC